MTVVQSGSINTTALIVPDLYVQIVAPSVALLNGVPTNTFGIVGTAQWGPANAPVVVGNMADYSRHFGAIQARKYDMDTAVAAAVLQGANNFRCVRVTDGTDTAASVVAQTNYITFASKYTGTLGNSAAVAKRITSGDVTLLQTGGQVAGGLHLHLRVFSQAVHQFWLGLAHARCRFPTAKTFFAIAVLASLDYR